MKKVLIIFSILVLVSLVTWFLLRDSETPLVETVINSMPFGSGDDFYQDSSPLTTRGDEVAESGEFNSPNSKFFRVSDTPVAGFIALSKSTSTIIRYADRATGHIYDFNAVIGEKAKITNQTLPKIYEAYFRPDGNAVIYRYLKNDTDAVENVSLILTPLQATVSTSSPQATPYTVSSVLLRGDIGSVAVGSNQNIFYSLRDTSSIVSSLFNGSGLRTILSSPFTDWDVKSFGNNLLVTTKASSEAPGYAYTISTSNGVLTKILGPLNGLTVMPNAIGNRVLYSHTEDGAIKLFSRNLTTNIVSEILPATLAEKCVWSRVQAAIVLCGEPSSGVGSKELDNWYSGNTHFSDRIWRFNTDTQVAELLAEPKIDIGIDIDVYQPKLSPNENYLIFINRNDMTLWTLRLE